MKKPYVAGFAFDKSLENVLMIRKTKPEWQAGLLNGIGGKIESYDHDVWAAQSREFWEETGLIVPPLRWYKFDLEVFDHSVIHWFYAAGVDLAGARKTTEEEPVIVPVRDLVSYERTDAIYNIHYLLSKALTFAHRPDVELPKFYQL